MQLNDKTVPRVIQTFIVNMRSLKSAPVITYHRQSYILDKFYKSKKSI